MSLDNTTLPSEQNEPAVVKYQGPADGPWSVYDGFIHDSVFRRGRTVVSGERGSSHAVAYCDYMWPERAEANARLIAAAPDMLAVLQRHVAGELGTFDEMKAAILKATGGAP